MAWSSVLTQLREALAMLYSTEMDARRLVDTAGMNSSRIDFSSHSTNTWHNVLSEADKQGKVSTLIAVALEEYPNDSHLIFAQRERDSIRSCN